MTTFMLGPLSTAFNKVAGSHRACLSTSQEKTSTGILISEPVLPDIVFRSLSAVLP